MPKKEPRFGAFSSSADPQKLALSVKAGIGAIATILLSLAPAFGVDLSGIDFNALAESLYNSIISAGTAVSSLALAYGLLRKIYFKFLKK